MSQANVEAIRRSNAAFNRRDRAAAFADYHEDVELRDLQHSPDAPERLRGRAAVTAYLEQWEDAFDEFTAEIEEYIDAGNSVVAVTHWRARGKESGLQLDQRTAEVFEFAHGKVIRATMGYATKAEALQAVRREE
jgi:ketosteroid isomerase-like protein